MPSFASKQHGSACWTCGCDHLRRNCPHESEGRSSQARSQSSLVVFDNCGRAGHPRDRCFELHPELTSSVRDRGGDASRSRGGQDGRGAGAVGRTAGIATSATESDMDALIEQLKQRLVAMAGPGASTSTPYEGENFSYLASAAQVEASVVVTKGGARALEPRGTTLELDSQRVEDGQQARLSQSFLLSEVDKTSFMIPAPPSDPLGRTETSTSHVVETDIPSTVVMRMVI